MYAKVLSYAALGAACAWGAWSFQGNRYERQLSELRTEYAQAQVRAVEHAHAETIRLQSRKDEAERANQVRLAALSSSVAAARVERDGLRDELSAARVQMPDASCGSVRDHAATLNDVFGECATAIEGLAGKAQGHAFDALKLIESWPK